MKPRFLPSHRRRAGSILMEYVMLTALFSCAFIGASGYLVNPSGRTFTVRETVTGDDFGTLGNAYVTMVRRAMEGLGSPLP